MPTQIDLTQLAAPRVGSHGRRAARRDRFAILTRYVIPFALVGGFATTLGYAFRESLWSGQSVTVIPVVAVRAETTGREGAVLFQSAGWVEPRPTPIVVSALEEGVVEKLFAIEGQELSEGAVVAQLIDADARLRLMEAEAELRSRLADLAGSQAALVAAETRLAEPIELQTALAEAEAMAAKVEGESVRLPAQIAAARSRLQLAEKEKQSRENSADSVGKLALARAVNEHQTAHALVGELESQRSALEKEHAAQGRRVAGLRRQLELRTEERRRRDEAKAAVELAESRVNQARIAIESAKLRLGRMTVRAPVAGKVLSLVARPGGKLMGLSPASGHDATTVITMYDPHQLQIRADVRLEEVPNVAPGQRVRIETPAVKGTLSGRVIAATSLADIQKNTLQVKVAIDDPPAVLKPDMLVQVSFLALASEKTATDAGGAVAFVIPSHLIRHDGQTASVWLVDQERGVARLRTIELGGANAEGWREVKRGLSAGDRLIASGAEGLSDGQRIRVAGEAPDESRTVPAANHDHPANQ